MPRVDQPKVLQTVVLYLDNQFENLPPKCEECIAKIHAGQYQAVNLKKLKGHDLYRAVVDHDTRLIFSRQKIHGQHVLLLIWIVNNHDYSKVPYFKPGVLEQFLEKNALAIEKVGDDHFEDLDDSDEIITKAEKWEYKKSLHYDKACIVLSHDQLSIIETKPPLLITGMPGSGKTCVAFVAILEYVKQHAHENHHIVYITNSDNLAKHLQSLWQASTQVPPNRCTITFVAYNTFIESSRAFSSTDRFVGLETFEAWFKNKNPNIAFADYYHECSIISICKELDEYLNFGARGSLLTCIDEKLALYRLCNEYNEYRNKNHLVDLNLDDFIFPREIDLVIADEAQDFSYPKIQTILTMAKNENHIFCGDGNQRLLKSVSNAPFIWQQLLKSDQKPTHCILKRLFRNPKLVQELSARVLKVKNHLIGGVTDSSEAIEGATCDDETRLGAIHWLNEVTQTIHDLCRSVDCAIIIDSEEQRAEAESLFNTLLIFTVDQIKGLQFPVIVLFNPFMKKIYREINKMIPDDLADKSFNHNRPKSKEDKTYYDAATELNRLYTKITRASVSVHIMQTHGHIPRKLLDYLKVQAATSSNQSEDVPVIMPSSDQQWQDLANELRSQNLNDHANRIEQKIKPSKKPKKSAKPVAISDNTLTGPTAPIKSYSEMMRYSIAQLANSLLGRNFILRRLNEHPKWNLYLECSKQKVSFEELIVQLLACDFGMKALLVQATRYPDTTFSIITAKMLYEEMLFRRLCDFDDGLAFLTMLFELNPQLCAAMPANALFENQCKAPVLIFNYLASLISGHKLLATIYNFNHAALQTVTAPHLFKTSKAIAGTKQLSLSAFHHFCFIQSAYQTKLLSLFLFDLGLWNNVTMLDLWGDPKNPLDTPMMPLWYLSGTTEKVNLVHKLFINKPELLNDLTNDILFTPPVGLYFTKHHNMPLAGLYLSFSTGWDFLFIILQKRKDLIESITSDQLCHKFDNETPGVARYASILSMFILHATSISPFFKILKESPTLANKLTSEAFYRIYEDQNSSILYNRSPFFQILFQNEQLEFIYKSAPRLFSGITKDAITKFVPNLQVKSRVVKLCGLQLLASCETNRRILYKLILMNEAVFTGLSAKIFFLFTHIQNEDYLNSVFQDLIETPLGLMILSKLVSLNKQLLPHLNLKALHYAYPHTEMQTPLTTLVFFATHTMGIPLLQMIIDTHSEVRQFLTPEMLNTNVTLIDNSVNNLQALLEKSEAGKKVLATLTTPSVANNALAFFSHKALDTMEEILTKANADLQQIQIKRSQNIGNY